MTTEAQRVEQRKWEVEDAARTLTQAAKIKRDSKLYKAAIAELKKQKEEITKVISANKNSV